MSQNAAHHLGLQNSGGTSRRNAYRLAEHIGCENGTTPFNTRSTIRAELMRQRIIGVVRRCTFHSIASLPIPAQQPHRNRSEVHAQRPFSRAMKSQPARRPDPERNPFPNARTGGQFVPWAVSEIARAGQLEPSGRHASARTLLGIAIFAFIWHTRFPGLFRRFSILRATRRPHLAKTRLHGVSELFTGWPDSWPRMGVGVALFDIIPTAAVADSRGIPNGSLR